MSKLKYRICRFTIISFLCLASSISIAQINSRSNNLIIGNYSRDSLSFRTLPLNFRTDFLSPFDFRNQTPLFLNKPSNLETSFTYEPDSKQFVLTQKMGSLEYRKPQTVSFKDFQTFTHKKTLHDFWKQSSRSVRTNNNGGIIPSIYTKNRSTDKIFGSNFVDIRPQGSAE